MCLRVLVLKSCCCCISLRSGAKIFGFISLIVFSCLTVVLVHRITDRSKGHKQWRHSGGHVTARLAVQLMQIVASCLLLLGVFKERAKLMPWWLLSTLLIVMWEAFAVTVLAIKYYDKRHPADSTSLFLELFTLGADVYGWLVVYSYYRSLVAKGRTLYNPESGDPMKL